MDRKVCKDALSKIARKYSLERESDEYSLHDLAMEIDGEKICLESVFPAIGKLMTSPSYYLIQVFHSMEKNVRDMLGDFDLTRTQLSLLVSIIILTRDREVVTQMDLANFLKADKMMVSEVLRTLERKGYILRQDHPSDRRAKSLIVTEKGFEVFEVASKQAVEFDEQYFSALGDDKEEFIRMLKKLL